MVTPQDHVLRLAGDLVQFRLETVHQAAHLVTVPGAPGPMEYREGDLGPAGFGEDGGQFMLESYISTTPCEAGS